MKGRARFVLTLAFAGCVQEEARPPVIPRARVVGPPESCISTTRLGQSRVRDDWTIDFVAEDGRVWRNTLSYRCAGLKVNHAFEYETALTQLCNTDIIHVLESTDRLRRGASCSLGEFVPVKLEEPDGPK